MRVSTLLVAMVLAGCGLLGSSAPGPSRGGLRRFYLTKDAVQGNRATSACGRGFHMASRFEILEPSVLDYDTTLGLTTDDSGSGPPSRSGEYGSPDPVGWIRTGGPSKFHDGGTTPGAAAANCASWSTNGRDTFGAAAYLVDVLGSVGGAPVPVWAGGSEPCERTFHVWCVEDRPAAELTGLAVERRRRGRDPD